MLWSLWTLQSPWKSWSDKVMQRERAKHNQVVEHSVHHHSQRHGRRWRSLLKYVEISGATSSATCTSSIPRYFMLKTTTSKSSLTAKKVCTWESFNAVLQCILTAFLQTETELLGVVKLLQSMYLRRAQNVPINSSYKYESDHFCQCSVCCKVTDSTCRSENRLEQTQPGWLT